MTLFAGGNYFDRGAAGSGTAIIDADGDTKVDVEESADDDTVRMDVGDLGGSATAQPNIFTLSATGLSVNMGTNAAGGTPGDIILRSGRATGGGGTSDGGLFLLDSGNGGPSGGDGGGLRLEAGDSPTATGGLVRLAGGASGSGKGGSVFLEGGFSDTELGSVIIRSRDASLADAVVLEFRESTGSGNNFVGFRAPDTLASDTTYTWPAADGAANELLFTDGSGNLDWIDVDALGADHGSLAGLADDDHSQYFLLAGRSGGQSGFGSPTNGEDLTLAGNPGANPGFINLNSPVIFGPYTGNPSAAYGFDYSVVDNPSGAFVGGGLNFSGTITTAAATFIYESFRGAPTITTGANPGFAAYTVMQALPTMIAGAGAGHNPLSPLIINAGVTVRNPFSGTRTTGAVTGMNFSSTLHAAANGAVMNVTNWIGLNVAPTWNTQLNSTIDFGNITGVYCRAPAQNLFGGSAGTERLVSYYGLQIENPGISNATGTAPVAAVRSEITSGTNKFFLLNPGGADSTIGGQVTFTGRANITAIFQAAPYVNTNIGINMGTSGTSRARLVSLGSGAFRMDNTGGTFANQLNWDLDSTFANDVTVTTGLNSQLEFDLPRISFGNLSPTGSNWFLGISAAAKTITLAGDFTNCLNAAGGNHTIDAALAQFSQWIINAPAGTIGTGSVTNACNVVVQTGVTIGTNRYGLLVTSNPSGGTENWCARFTGAAGVRVDSMLQIDAALDVNTTTVTATTHTAANEYVILVDDDTAAAAVTVTLPPAADSNRKYYIKKLGSTASVTIDGDGAETIDGGTTAVLNSQYESLTLVSDGTEWWIL